MPDSIRELAICRVAGLNKAEHEWKWHFPLLVKALPSIPVGIADYVRNAAPLSKFEAEGTIREQYIRAMNEK